MQLFANPLLRHVIGRGCFDAASKRQCPQYLRALRTLQLNGFNTGFLGETDIPESLITGEKKIRRGWVPWRYKLLLRGNLPIHEQNGIFQEFCESLTTSCGKCIIVMRDKTQPMLPPEIYMSTTECCPEVAKANGHELLVVPSSYNYLYPMDITWSSLKWFIINNRKVFALKSVERTHSYRCILLSDLILKGIENMTPNKWKAMINRVKRWENYYLDTLP
ncbi:PREDICTED: uncharacterized protein C21orf140 homolog [Cariama cristata]|uniref:uncharacterized protein C21orf140 homolog n=1 Tax=Cariama cristata TaxID=54380 RepID=UPI00052004CA|nr:PREDICTED: uncharacterized protein C21orf140 homolog [Cariama cristata]